MLKKNKLIISSFIIVIAVLSLSAFGQRSEDKPEDTRITIQMDQKPLYTIFYMLIQKYDVAIGLEESVLDRDHRHYEFEPNIKPDRSIGESYKDKEALPPMPKVEEHLISVNFEDAKLEDVMDSIVKQMKHYDWEMIDGVVNIYPKSGRDPRLKKLLDLKVSVFTVSEGSEIGRIQANLMLFLPEFKEFLLKNNIEASTLGWSSSFRERLFQKTMVFRDMTFKELLNAITKSKRGGWMLKIKKLKSHSEKEFIEILI